MTPNQILKSIQRVHVRKDRKFTLFLSTIGGLVWEVLLEECPSGDVNGADVNVRMREFYDNQQYAMDRMMELSDTYDCKYRMNGNPV